MVKSLETFNANWSKSPIFKLEPDIIEKEIKTMNNKSLKLNGRFISMKLNPNKTTKTQAQDGPFVMLESLNGTIKEYLKNLPLIKVFSNPGMEERHWQEVSKYT